MIISLDAKSKLGFVDGSLSRHAIDNCFFKNSMVKSWLLNIVSKEIYFSILYYDDDAQV